MNQTINTGGADQTNIQSAATSISSKRSISVQASGEVCCPPDVIQFSVSIISSKDSVEAAQTSIKRRTDYITQVLHNNGIKDKGTTCSTDIQRAGECVTMQTDISVNCDSLSRCEAVRNLLIEKMDSSVQFVPVSYHHSAEAKESARQEAFKKAVSNAKAKAQCISQTVGVQLGPALEVIEVTQDSFLGPDTGVDARESDPNKSLEQHSASLHQNYRDATITYSSHVSVSFESQPLRSCNHKKCRKH